MNTPAKVETALALPDPKNLTSIITNSDDLGELLSRLERAARSEAANLDTARRKDRDALKSLAYKVSQSKSELDRQGLALTEEARNRIDAVNAGRKQVRERLEALRDELKKPVAEWEAAEEARISKHKDALGAFDIGRVDSMSTAEMIRAVVVEVEQIDTGEGWEEYQPVAEAAKEKAMAKFRVDLATAVKREAEQAELAKLRAEAEERARKDAEEKAAREAEAAARRKAAEDDKRKKDLADRLVTYCENCARGIIGGQPQPFAILMHDLEKRIQQDAEAVGDHWPQVDLARRKAIASLKEDQAKEEAALCAQLEREKAEAAERASREAEERAANEKREAEERHSREIAEAKAREERAAQAERERIEAEARDREEEARKRAADKAHRNRILKEISEALMPIPRESIPQSLLDGRIPHVKVTL